jgi:hypothetical protein
MVHLNFTCDMLGVEHRLGGCTALSITPAWELSAMDCPSLGTKGGIMGQVLWGAAPAGNTVLRLVRASDCTLVPSRKTTTDQEGRYESGRVQPGDCKTSWPRAATIAKAAKVDSRPGYVVNWHEACQEPRAPNVDLKKTWQPCHNLSVHS